jgi:hypothetical protein
VDDLAFMVYAELKAKGVEVGKYDDWLGGLRDVNPAVTPPPPQPDQEPSSD